MAQADGHNLERRSPLVALAVFAMVLGLFPAVGAFAVSENTWWVSACDNHDGWAKYDPNGESAAPGYGGLVSVGPIASDGTQSVSWTYVGSAGDPTVGALFLHAGEGQTLDPIDPLTTTVSDADGKDVSFLLFCFDDPVAAPSIDVEKSVSGDGSTYDDADSAPGITVSGASVWYEVVVTNTGNIDLFSFGLTDTVTTGPDAPLDFSGCNVPQSLSPGGSFTCSFGPLTSTIGDHTDVVDVSAWNEVEQQVFDSDPASYVRAEQQTLTSTVTVTKVVTGNAIPEDGDFSFLLDAGSLTETFDLTAGSTTLTSTTHSTVVDAGSSVTLTETVDRGATSTSMTLDGSSWNGTGFTAQAGGSYDIVVTNDFTERIVPTPGIDVEKTVYGSNEQPLTDTVAHGSSLFAQIVVSETTGEAPLTNVTVTDTFEEDVTIDGTFPESCNVSGDNVVSCTFQSIPAGQTATVMIDFTLGGDCSYDNQAEASADGGLTAESNIVSWKTDGDCGGGGDNNPPPTITSTPPPSSNPAVDVEKLVSADGSSFTDADSAPGIEIVLEGGGSVFFRMIVENTGDVTLSGINLSDAVTAGDAAAIDTSGCAIPASLAPGASFTCDFGPFAAAVGQHTNVATVTATGDDQQVSDTDPANYEGVVETQVLPEVIERDVPSIALTKTALVDEGADGFKVVTFSESSGGEEVVYEYLVTNDGSTTLTDIVLVDDVLGEITLATTTLEPGESTVGTATHVVTQADADAGTIVNVAVVNGTAPDGTVVDATDDEQVDVIQVLPEVIERPPDAAPEVQPQTLPRTGADSWLLLAAALAGLFGGGALLFLSRRHEVTLRSKKR